MISQAKIKLIHSLESKKGRKKEHAFVAEGPKVVGDLLAVSSPRLIVATEEWLKANQQVIGLHSNNQQSFCETIVVSDAELRKVSFLQHPQQVLAIFPLPQDSATSNSSITNQHPPHRGGLEGLHELEGLHGLSLALDGVQDPGNLGTIIRIADWFGITTLLCSHETADAYSPKVIQATMGSIARVRPIYVDLKEVISQLPDDYPIYGTLLDGKNIYEQELTDYGMIIMGNEGNGISEPIRRLVNHRLLIPNYPPGRETADSLNVAIATAITCSEFRRRQL